jgi:hypothetical protein
MTAVILILTLSHGVDSRDGFDGQLPGHASW